MKFTIPTILLLIAFIGCQNETMDPQKIIDDAIKAHGSSKLNSSLIEFEFRDREYGVKYSNGLYEMVRLWGDSTLGVIRDEVTNEGFKREVNGELIDVPDTMANKYTNSINSVIYYALLPYRLNDAAVNKKYLGKETVKNQEYYLVEITFDKEGGGQDFDDVYVYWVNTQNNFIDYFAYSYASDGGGVRFREAINPRVINEVRITDYNNYKAPVGTQLKSLAQQFESEKLEKLSVIELQNVIIEPFTSK